jgi:hypothetical protein
MHPPIRTNLYNRFMVDELDQKLKNARERLKNAGIAKK